MQLNFVKRAWNLATDWRLIAYNAVIIIGSPYFLLKKLRRQYTHPNAIEFRMFNWSCPVIGPIQQNAEDATNALNIVFLSGSLGELHTTEQLDFALKKSHPNVKTTWALGDPDLVEVVRRKYPQQAVTAIPYDFIIPVYWWLRRLKPDVVVMVEELWLPNVVWTAKQSGALVLAVCARCGTMSLNGLRGAYLRPVYRWTLKGFTEIGFSGQGELNSAKSFLSHDDDLSRVTGQVKLSQIPKLETEQRQQTLDLAHWLSSGQLVPLLIAGSTKDIEEESLILKAFDLVRAQIPCALVLAPRRLHRADEILALFLEHGVQHYARRSEYSGEPPGEITEVYLLDTLGELSLAYQFAQAAYVGGTLRGTGHNIIEPIEWGLSVCFGPGRGKPTPEQQACLDEDVGFSVSTPQQLADIWLKVLRDHTWRGELEARAQKIVCEQKQALDKNLAVIVNVLSTLDADRSRNKQTQNN